MLLLLLMDEQSTKLLAYALYGWSGCRVLCQRVCPGALPESFTLVSVAPARDSFSGRHAEEYRSLGYRPDDSGLFQLSHDLPSYRYLSLRFSSGHQYRSGFRSGRQNNIYVYILCLQDAYETGLDLRGTSLSDLGNTSRIFSSVKLVRRRSWTTSVST